jgi:outer membrane protein assembly factor BamB
MGTGTRLVEFSFAANGLVAKELWTSLDMKPDYNDILIHERNIYGFDSAIFACIGLEDGKRKWKGGRYAKGQALLLADSGLIVVVGDRLYLRNADEVVCYELATAG